MKRKFQWVTVRTPLQDIIDQANSPMELSCDWLGQWPGGILIFPPNIYAAMHAEAARRAEENGRNTNSGIEQ